MRKSSAQFDWFAEQCKSALTVLYSDVIEGTSGRDSHQAFSFCLRYLIRMLATLIAAERISKSRKPARSILEAADIIRYSASECISDPIAAFESCLLDAFQAGAPDILENRGEPAISKKAFSEVSRLLVLPRCNTPFDLLFFETMPLTWLGQIYQVLLSYEPSMDGSRLVFSRAGRKRRGVYFTPPCLVSYIVESVLAHIVNGRNNVFDCGSVNHATLLPTVLDPAMGSGDFLCGVVEFLSQNWCSNKLDGIDELCAQAAARCVYGVDVDPVAVEIGFLCGRHPVLRMGLCWQ